MMLCSSHLGFLVTAGAFVAAASGQSITSLRGGDRELWGPYCYSCEGGNDPCAQTAGSGRQYFPHCDPSKYFHCGARDWSTYCELFVKSCMSGQRWEQRGYSVGCVADNKKPQYDKKPQYNPSPYNPERMPEQKPAPVPAPKPAPKPGHDGKKVGPSDSVNQCQTYVFHEFMKGGDVNVVFKAPPFILRAYCEPPSTTSTTGGPDNTFVYINLEVYDRYNDLLVFGQSAEGVISDEYDVLEDHILPKGTTLSDGWFEENRIGTENSYGSFLGNGVSVLNHGAVMVSTRDGIFSYLSASADTMIGIQSDEGKMRSFIPDIDCIVAGTVCVALGIQSDDSDV